MKRNLIVGLVVIAACAVLVQWSSCGGGGGSTPAPSDAPTISDITISGGNAVHSTVDLTADPIVTNVSTATSSVAVTFTPATTVTVPDGSVTLTCASGTTPTLGTPTSSGNTFTFPITGNFPQLTSCTLAFSAAITNGTPMVAVSKNFATGCSTSDSFTNSETLANCWTEQASSAGTTTIANNALTLVVTDFIASGQGPAAFKTFASSDTTITQTVKLTATNLIEEQDQCSFALFETLASGVILQMGWSGSDAQMILYASNNSAQTNKVLLGTDTSVMKYLRLSYSGGIITASYSTDGTTFTALAPTFSFAPTGDVYSFVEAEHGHTAHTDSCKFENYTVTGASATNSPAGTTGGQD